MKSTGSAEDSLESSTQANGGDNDEGGGGAGIGVGKRNVVVVGVKLDQHCRELLTWTLMKVAQPGDRVVALHALHSSEEQTSSSLLSLVKTFESVISVYEGFCHLKQVDLKLKISRGSSVRKILIREAIAYESATLVVGTSKTHHAIRSPASIAKHCARKLSHKFSVYAIDNGKIVFRREANPLPAAASRKNSPSEDSFRILNVLNLDDSGALSGEVESDPECRDSSAKHGSREGRRRKRTLIRRYFGCGKTSSWADHSCDLPEEEPVDDCPLTSSLAMVPFQDPTTSSGPKNVIIKDHHEPKQGWALLRSAFLPKNHQILKTSSKNKYISEHKHQSTVSIHPDEEFCQKDQDLSNINRDNLSVLDEENSTIVPFHSSSVSPTCSPARSLKSFAGELEGFHARYSSLYRLFTYPELVCITSGFIPERMVGKGGSSRVFKGHLSNGKELAIKILKPSEDALTEFVAEFEILTSVSHKNIISLFGFCFENENPVLVYNFLPRGSLEDNLHDRKKDSSAFGWEERYKVALGVAEALEHLHNRSSEPVIHRDVKSSNILLDEDYIPQLSDFGLATLASNAASYKACAGVAGTFGYVAPEYFMHGKVTEKIDVYAYGVVLLELLSGRKPIDNLNPKGQESLVIWASPILRDGKVSELLDTSLGSEYDHNHIERMALAATLCLRREPLFRPRISMVLKLLQGDDEIIRWARQQVSNTSVDLEGLDGQSSPKEVIQSHLNVAFLDMEDDGLSVGSSDLNISVEDYLKGRWSRTPSLEVV